MMMSFWTSGYAIEKNENILIPETPAEIKPLTGKTTKSQPPKTHYGMGYEQRMKHREAGFRRTDINRIERHRRPERPARPGR